MKNVAIFLDPKGTTLEVLRTAKLNGCFVLAVFSDDKLLVSPPEPYISAVDCIDLMLYVDLWDDVATQKIIEISRSLGRVSSVYSGLDSCTHTAAKLRVNYGLPTTTPDTIALILDKERLRNRLVEMGLSKLMCVSQNTASSWFNWEFDGPAYFKPVSGSFSAYVKRCNNFEEFEEAWRAWADGDGTDPKFIKDYVRSSNRYYLEQAFDGELLSAECFSSAGEFECLGLLSRILYSKNPVIEMGSCFPYPHPLYADIVAKVKRAHELLEFTDGPSHVELIVSNTGDIEIIDFNPRFAGADVLQSVNQAYDMRIQEHLFKWAAGGGFQLTFGTTQFACLQYVLPPEALIFESVSLPITDEVKFRTEYVKQGTALLSLERQLDYIGCYLTVMPTFEEANQRSKDLRREIKINGSIAGAY